MVSALVVFIQIGSKTLHSDFAKLASKRRLTPECLAQRFAGKIERPGEFFDRVFKSQYAAVVIPYRSVLAAYSSELRCHQDVTGRVRMCACVAVNNPYLIGKSGRA